MDTKLPRVQMSLPSRKLSQSSPSHSSTPMQFQGILCTVKISIISISPSTTESRSSERFHPSEMSPKLMQSTGPLQDPSAQFSFQLSTPSCYPNRMMALSHSTQVEARLSVHCISPLVFASPPLLWSITPSCETSGKIASNPFYRKRESAGSKRAFAM